MVSKRLYYNDTYATAFSAQVVEQTEYQGKTAVILSQSLFYPTSGGQPHDTGFLNETAVSNVVVRKEDEAILHILDGQLDSDQVNGKVNWQRRLDHIQQHTGQHILSQAFIQVANAPTISFHLSPESVTIDLDKKSLTDAEIAKTEQLANQIIWENRPIHVRMVSVEEAQTMNLRKLPPVRTGKLRLIDIENFDLTACGGTHVTQTGGVGIIKIIKQERRKNKLRIEFRCGGRALADYGHKNDVALQLGSELTTGLDQLLPSVQRLRDQLKEANRQIKQQQAALMAAQATQLLAKAERMGETAVVTHILESGSPNELQTLGQQLLGAGETAVCFLGLAGQRSHLLFCRTEDAPGNMGQLIKIAQAELGGGGGGRPERAQGGGPAATVDQIAQAIATAKQNIHP
ncbi:MAG: alanyl-tRNA editing protein [Chloroflexota bacterium]